MLLTVPNADYLQLPCLKRELEKAKLPKKERPTTAEPEILFQA